ncbi:hypothetical protein EMIHUDRAFT_121055 [Emiliania huxleyi CCMP1516]|uniref:SAM domain-containing protein n=2 Tax=Emiliania huxleyi TaxID=2903 RepID=A0A0D3I961_EMIH1|nr:hypothetical protein EMIHUDRAFT_121055 [Emiliania huxleyi CCMP1516]EOD07796.1 hypothetical protein EMIHUDRAFT_121055 [Emiliania huxleyi CCMP1516]|eukprot:XP_005760225.1 hypothetical protein EMIHUDRAFT_121055 [Emiliania huxleyi CCMP1516]
MHLGSFLLGLVATSLPIAAMASSPADGKEVQLQLSNGAVYNVSDGECSANADMCFTPSLAASKNEAAVRELLSVSRVRSDNSSTALTEASLEASFQAIVDDTSDSFDLKDDETLTLELTNDVNIRALAVGLYINNIEAVSPSIASWQFDGRLYVREVMLGRPYESRQQAIRAIYRNPEDVMARPDGTSFVDVEDWDDDRFAFECTREALDSTRDLTSATFDNVFRLAYENARSEKAGAPQFDPEGHLKYIKLMGSYSYRPQQSRYPFSTERLKFTLTSDLEFFESKLAFNMLCIDPSFTGFAQPDMLSWPSREDSRIRYGELDPVTGTSNGMLVAPLVEFTIVLTPTRIVGFFVLMPIFAATLATQLQWKKPVYAIDQSAAISSILLISGAIAAHLSKSIADECAYAMYIITGWYIFSVAVISGRNAASAHEEKALGSAAFQRRTARLYSLMRRLGLLWTILFIPAGFHSVDDYGRTSTMDGVWAITVGVLCGAVSLLIGVALLRYCIAERNLEAAEAAKTAEELEVILPSLDEKPPAEWSVLEVAVWLEHSPALARLGLTERAALRATLSKEKMDGVSLALCAEFELLHKLGVAAGSAVQAKQLLVAKPPELAGRSTTERPSG